MLRLFLLFLSSLFMSGVGGEAPTLQDLQDTYKQSQPGLFICYYDGRSCNRERQVCSPQARTCEEILLFEKDATDDQKLRICREYIKNDTYIDPFIYDACIYIIGKMTAERKVDCDLPNLPITRPVGEDFCPFINPSTGECYLCKRGKEFCTETGCQPLFKRQDLSDEEKQEYCLKVIEENETSSKYDSCLYALGSLGSLLDDIKKLIENNTNTVLDLEAKIAELKKQVKNRSRLPPCSPKSNNPRAIPVRYIATLASTLVGLCVAIVTAILCCKRKKLTHLKGPKQVDEEDPAGGGDDQNREDKKRLTENPSTENLDGVSFRPPDPGIIQLHNQIPADANRKDGEVKWSTLVESIKIHKLIPE